MCHIALLSNSITATERGSFPETLIFANRIKGGNRCLTRAASEQQRPRLPRDLGAPITTVNFFGPAGFFYQIHIRILPIKYVRR